MAGSLTDRVRDEVRAYAGDDERPLAAYTALLSAYGVTTAGLLTLMAARGRKVPKSISGRDLALLSIATFKLSRILTRDTVTSPLRAPFTRFEGPADAPAEVHEQVRGSGLRKAVGELLTCPFCIGQWAATALVGGLLVAPRQTRVAASILALTTANDALHLAYSAATKAAG